MSVVVNVLQAETERRFDIDICDLLTTLSIFRSDIFCIFLDVKKRKLARNLEPDGHICSCYYDIFGIQTVVHF